MPTNFEQWGRRMDLAFTRTTSTLEYLKPQGVCNRLARAADLQVLVLYGLVALGLLAPMASSSILPDALDHANHTAIIVQARMAIEEGQFPIRVAPWQNDGYRLPLFQFYSPLVYTCAGAIHKWVFPNNPFLAYKFMLWFALVLGGYFTFRIVRRLTASLGIAVTVGILYMSSPYWLINIHARGAFTEALGQGVMPVVVYATLRCYARGRASSFLAAAIAWFALATTHLVSFVYLSLFLGLLLPGLAIFSAWNGNSARRLIRSAGAYAVGCLLGFYFLAPIAYANPFLTVTTWIPNPITLNWLTPISMLLSPVSVPPEPSFRGLTTPLYPSVGWPTLAAIVVCVMALAKGHQALKGPRLRQFTIVLLGLFCVSLFMTWSPVDFWRWLPKTLHICQFPYRLLAQAEWIGAILVGVAIYILWGHRFDVRHVVIGVLLIVASHGSYLPPQKASALSLEQIRAKPDMGYGAPSYRVELNHPMIQRYTVAPTNVVSHIEAKKSTRQHQTVLEGEFLVKEEQGAWIQLPMFFYPKLLDVRVDGARVLPFCYQGMVALNLAKGSHRVDATFVGMRWANWVSGIAWLAVLVLLAVRLVTGLLHRRSRRPAVAASPL
jgi:hypothetical protein